jgi:hypothetical protein
MKLKLLREELRIRKRELNAAAKAVARIEKQISKILFDKKEKA